MCRAGIRGPGGGVGPAENVAAGGTKAEEMELDSDDTDVCFALLAFFILAFTFQCR